MRLHRAGLWSWARRITAELRVIPVFHMYEALAFVQLVFMQGACLG